LKVVRSATWSRPRTGGQVGHDLGELFPFVESSVEVVEQSLDLIRQEVPGGR
jgi:hypothetical protein